MAFDDDSTTSFSSSSSDVPSKKSSDFVDTDYTDEQKSIENIQIDTEEDIINTSEDEVDWNDMTSWTKDILQVQYFADPRRWGNVWEELPSLTPVANHNAWLTNEMMEWYILYQLKNPLEGQQYMVYIPIDVIQQLQAKPHSIDEQTIDHFNKFLKMQRPASTDQAAFMLCRNNHWFAVVFDWTSQNIWVFNRTPHNNSKDSVINTLIDRWIEWNGLQLWNSVANLLTWTHPPNYIPKTFLQAKSLSWFGDGINCGTECIVILKDILFTNGLRFESKTVEWPLRPHIPCWQVTRSHVLNIIANLLHTAFGFWKRHHTSFTIGKDWIEPWILPEDLEAFHAGIKTCSRIKKLQHQLTRAVLNCKSCPEHSKKPISSSSIPTDPASIPPSKSLMLLPHTDSDLESDENASMSLTDVRAIVRRERHAEAPEIPSDALKIERPRMIKYFDDFNTGPTIQDNQDVPLHIKNIPIFNRTQLEPLSVYSLWRDYGYRIDSNFALSFNSKVPFMPEEHYLPIAESTGDHVLVDQLKQWSLSRGEHKRMAVSQIRILGMEEMTRIAGEKGSLTSIDLFTRGIYYDPPVCNDAEFIHLDPRQDAYNVTDVNVSLDIDSLIWTTADLYFSREVKIYMSAVMRDKPPIQVHNHRTVNILLPQTDIQRANNEYTDFIRVPLSKIPHTMFGQFGDGAGSGNIIVCFPRMMHRQQDSPYWATLIPSIILDIWFGCIIQPAMKRIASLGTMEYINFTTEEWKAKTTRHKGNPESRPVSERKMPQLIETMRDIIQQDIDLEDLDIFGSFFFVVEIRGCKYTIKDRETDDVLAAMQRAFPVLDLDAMAVDPYSECVLDLGMSLVPPPETSLVGLWRITHIDASFAKAGANKPDLHAMGTLSDHGSLQAEFPRDRSAATHMVFRSAYNLVFEIVRGGITFCQNADAHAGNAMFHKCINNYITAYRNARERTYGVRDEYRTTIQAIKEILPVATIKAKALAHSGAVTWIPSAIFFEFWIRRLQELEQVQVNVNKKQPSVRCSTTLLLMHMFKTIITTPRMDPLTYSLWKDLNSPAIINRFGMFFLQTQSHLTLEIEGISKDAEDITAFVLNRSGKRKVANNTKPADFDSRRTMEYPIGSHPTWQEITDIFLSHPATLVSSRCGNNFWNGPLTALQIIIIDLLIKFTKQYWFTLDQAFLVNSYPNPQSWNDVMHVWSIEGIQKIVQNPVFVPHKYHWEGLPRGPQQESFQERATTFFPPTNITFADSSVWKRFERHGYIRDYHAYLTDTSKSEDEKKALQEGMKEAFGLLNCLPNRKKSPVSNAWQLDDEKNGPTFIVNAETYRIRGVGKKSFYTTTGRLRLAAPARHIDVLLLVENEGIQLNEAEKQVARQARKKPKRKWATTSKNYRKPPTKTVTATKPQRATSKKTQTHDDAEQDDIEETEEEEEDELTYDIDDFDNDGEDEADDS